MVDLRDNIIYYNEAIEVYVRLLYLPNIKQYMARLYTSIEDMLAEPRLEKQGINYVSQRVFETSNVEAVKSWYEQRGCKRYE